MPPAPRWACSYVPFGRIVRNGGLLERLTRLERRGRQDSSFCLAYFPQTVNAQDYRFAKIDHVQSIVGAIPHNRETSTNLFVVAYTFMPQGTRWAARMASEGSVEAIL